MIFKIIFLLSFCFLEKMKAVVGDPQQFGIQKTFLFFSSKFKEKTKRIKVFLPTMLFCFPYI